ncbi:DUF4389 domain-containing protein [Nocardia terpenica]|uniref:DUF4389 domain-containing protein n=1 Tax=Nocardia terpenica TaxID=455432 RepID=A0A164PIV8_9NOCA|nr:DUF4389 domain-containing protein [Nocardia terpenica]KZM75630.1 hypothetical protein AWN90_19915 [Nocardia terpenica]NQE86122.1 DUF4389 domain-containing protein [Nocardia terpenica]
MQPQTAAASPIRVRGDLDPAVSRWQWIFKWILAIPHYIVLFFLHIAYFVVTIVAFFAILIIGRYPRGLFDFSVGVLRWGWRVEFYAWSPLGTDRYPPFSLKSRDDYPADLEVDYPERLHRGLVLIKWWLLAIPQYLIVYAFVGESWSWTWRGDDGDQTTTMFYAPLLGILVLIAAIGLLFTGRYPRGLFDFVMGLNRWMLRVQIYTTLLRDEYPPFRLDQGAREPEAGPQPAAGAAFA